MELALFLFTILWSMTVPVSSNSSSIRCYKCDPTVIALNGHYQSCDYVNASDTAYVWECPRSTMCSKTVTTFNVGTTIKIRSVVRGCASQTEDDVYAKNGSSWYYPNIIHEPYEEKCTKVDPSTGDKVTVTLVCYCRGDLCNGNNDHNVPDASPRSTGFSAMWLAIGIILLSSC